jgi:hypothetical protein
MLTGVGPSNSTTRLRASAPGSSVPGVAVGGDGATGSASCIDRSSW